MNKKKKLVTAAAAVATSAALLLGGTFAWQSISQTALNEASDVINPGGRLHNDFVRYNDLDGEGTEISGDYADGQYNKDIYVENFAEDEIFARVRLSEYFEIVLNYNTAGEKEIPIIGSKTPKNPDADPVTSVNRKDFYEYEYETFTAYDTLRAGVDAADTSADPDGKAYWTWVSGEGSTRSYMPTFNKNKDSLEPDNNGAYTDTLGGISSWESDQYDDYVDYSLAENQTKSANAIYDIDSNTADELAADGIDVKKVISGEQAVDNYTAYIELLEEEHTAGTTGISNGLISMEDWLSMLTVDENGEYVYDEAASNYWVYDTDGWVYWSSPIPAGETTGLLLDEIKLNQVMDDTWYYAIHVDGQFCTAGDMGTAPVYSEDGTTLVSSGTGFYADDETVSDDALTLLELIGVNDTTSGGEGTDEEEENPEQIYNMFVYVTDAASMSMSDLVPGQEYTVEVVAEANDFSDTAVALSVMMEDGTALDPSAYTLTPASANFGAAAPTIGDAENGDQSAYAKLTILDESLVGQQITIVAVADQTGNTASRNVAVNYEELNVAVKFYNAAGEQVAGPGVGSTLDENSEYEIVGTITMGTEELVVYSTIPEQYPVSDRVDANLEYTAAHANIQKNNSEEEPGYNIIDSESGQLITGAANTFYGETEDYGSNAIRVDINFVSVSVYESAGAKTNGEAPTGIYAAYGYWDVWAEGYADYTWSALPDVAYAAKNQSTWTGLQVYDGNNQLVSTDGLTVSIEGATDTTGTTLALAEDRTYTLTIGENETAEKLILSAQDEHGKAEKTVYVKYEGTLLIGDVELLPGYNDETIASSSTESTQYTLTYKNYWGDMVSDAAFEFNRDENFNKADTKVEGNMLTLAAGEDYQINITVTDVTYYVVNTSPASESETTALTHSVVEPTEWDGNLAAGESVTLKVDGDYTAEDLEWSIVGTGAVCRFSCTENEDGSATITHNSSMESGNGNIVRVALASDSAVYLDIEIGCDTATSG